MPMARELGLGVTPWSPLRGGVLSRQVHARERRHGEGRPRRAGDELRSPRRTYAIVDELDAHRPASSAPRRRAVALAWVQARPGVTSTIIGARRLEQLDDNLAALEVALAARARRRARRGVRRRCSTSPPAC